MKRDFFTSSPVISGMMKDITVFSPLIEQRCKLTLAGDYHCTLNDERGREFFQYSARMAQYGQADMKELELIFEQAHNAGSDAIMLLGDIISFPTEKGVETLAGMIKDSAIPVYFIAGNHDWHYEGWPGSDMQQRQEWINKRLLPLYQGRDPMNYTAEVKGIKLIMVDNSVYEITASQLEFLRRELSDGKAAIVGCHIPFFLGMPHHTVTNFGCGHPEWGAESDPYHEIERRERWSENGLSAETFAFCREVMQADNVLGVAAGHSHTYCLETVNGKFQLVLSSRHSSNLTLFGN